jgi:hypothetical protein
MYLNNLIAKPVENKLLVAEITKTKVTSRNTQRETSHANNVLSGSH